MTENLLDFLDEDQQLKRRRRRRRITYNLYYFLIALCIINGVLVFTLLPDAVVAPDSPIFVGWKTRYIVSVTVLLLLPATAFLITLLLALIPVRATTYFQRGVIIFLLLMLAIEGACLFQIFTV